MAKTRRIFQILFLFFFLFLFIRARYPYEEGLASDLFLRFSPLIPLFDFIETLSISWLFWPALIIIFLTIFLGRFFCGWICPLGTILDLSNRIVASPSNKRYENLAKLRYLKFSVLILSILLAFFSINIWGYFDPLSLFNRTLTVVLYPLFTLGAEQSLLLVSEISFVEDLAYDTYDLFKSVIMPENQAHMQQIFWITFVFVGIIGLERYARRFWCRYICPAGAFLGFLSQWRFYERIVGSACPVCNKCQTECKMNAIPEEDVAHTDKIECIECFNCGEVCPPKANSITYRWRWKPYHTVVDFNRRQFITTTASSALTLGLITIGMGNMINVKRPIRPPGSLPENQFLDRCIRCLECVRICESNGGCLQPDQIHSSVLELWLPAAVMRHGYCEYNCNLCGQVCPTEAILPLSVVEKQRTPMGLAYFDKNICIPYAQNKDCIVCEEHCPTPKKAIQFENKEIVLSDGSSAIVKYPFVVRDLCVGCGICETKCPVPGDPGVYVTSENEIRPERNSIS